MAAGAVGLAAGLGCATGTPLGGQGLAAGLGEARPFGPPAAARPIPADLEGSSTDASTGMSAQREQLVAQARSFVGKKDVVVDGHSYGSDCTALVEAVYAKAGIPLLSAAQRGDNGVTAMYRYAQSHGSVFKGGRPLPGDLIFFRDTYDQNRDGRADDGLTHVGLVEAVDAQGTVTVIHRVTSGVVRYRMNLARPSEHLDGKTGQVLNDYLREPGPDHRLRLTGELFVAYGSVLSAAPLPVLRPQPANGSI